MLKAMVMGVYMVKMDCMVICQERYSELEFLWKECLQAWQIARMNERGLRSRPKEKGQ